MNCLTELMCWEPLGSDWIWRFWPHWWINPFTNFNLIALLRSGRLTGMAGRGKWPLGHSGRAHLTLALLPPPPSSCAPGMKLSLTSGPETQEPSGREVNSRQLQIKTNLLSDFVAVMESTYYRTLWCTVKRSPQAGHCAPKTCNPTPGKQRQESHNSHCSLGYVGDKVTME